jgi:hypothetical protein
MEIINGWKIFEQHPFWAERGTVVYGVFGSVNEPKIMEFSDLMGAVEWCRANPRPVDAERFEHPRRY